jgi:hypothetical protein
VAYFWACLFTLLGIVGGELIAWLHERWVDRYHPTMTIEEATEQLKAELAEHRRQTEEAMWRAIWDREE